MPKIGPDYTQWETEDGTVAYRKQEVDIKTKKKARIIVTRRIHFQQKKIYFSKYLRKHAIKF